MSKEYEIFYPGIYNDSDQKVMDAAFETLSKPQPSMPAMGPNTADEQSILRFSKTWYPYNPLFNDSDYAKKSVWNGLVAPPAYKEVGGGGVMVRFEGALEYRGMSDDVCIPGNGMDHEIFYYKPIMPGDEFTVENGPKQLRDITPGSGSTVRCIWSSGEVYLYNKQGDLVAKQISRMGSNFKRYKNPTDRSDNSVPRKNMAQYRLPHKYTEKDYEHLKLLWENEKIRGAEPLYWENVNIGDEPAPTCDGPFTAIDMFRLHGDGIPASLPMVREALVPSGLNKRGGPPMGFYEKDDYGLMYADTAQHYCDRNIPGARPVFYNTTARNLALRMVTNWCGDSGFVSKVGWRLCYETGDQWNVFPESWIRPSYLLQVPYLKEKGRYMNTHGIVGDTAISRGYVSEKFEREGKKYVEMVVWVEDIDGNIMQEMSCTVRLPSKLDSK